MSTAPDMNAGFTLVKAARALILDANQSVSDATKKQYASAFARLVAQNQLPEKLANTARSFYFYRAAWVHHYVAAIREVLNAADTAQRKKDFGLWTASIEKLPALIQQLELYRPDPNGKNLENGRIGKWSVELEKRQAAGERVRSHSKRTRLRGLPDTWRTLMFEGVNEKSKYRDVVAVLSATGARPSEFAKGINVERDGPDNLRFTIQGTKTHGGKYGQTERSFSVSVDRPELQYLADRIGNQADPLPLLVTASAGSLSDRVRQLSQKVFPNLRSTVSAYVFRHQAAADLKASGLPDESVSAALGHSVDETKRYYGSAQSAKEPCGITDIRASRPVRMKTREKIHELNRSREMGYQPTS